MLDKDVLLRAVEHRIINRSQVDPLYHFLSDEQAFEFEQQSHDEQPRFVRSFGDIFVSIGLVLLAIATGILDLDARALLVPLGGFILLAEWLVRRKRLALPGVVLLFCLLYIDFRLFMASFGLLGADEPGEVAWVLATLLSSFSILYYLRYRIPFAWLGIVAPPLGLAAWHLDALNHPVWFVVGGLLVFALAMSFDARDTERNTRYSDCGFWLHLLAAPMITHGSLFYVADYASTHQVVLNGVMTLLFFTVFSLVALFVDRRALLVASVSYVIWGLIYLIRSSDLSADLSSALSLIIVGLLIVMLGAGWYTLRRMLFEAYAGRGWTRWVPALDR